jgi:hypothetical protein
MPNLNIQKALSHLEEANHAGYFTEMDKVEMPKHLKPVFAQHKAVFVAGAAPFNFHQILTVFAAEVERNLPKENQESGTQTSENLPKNYKLGNINKLLMASYDDESLTAFCMFNFEKVHNNFGATQNKQQKVMALLDYCKRALEMEKLLDLLREENLGAFEQFKPYF